MMTPGDFASLQEGREGLSTEDYIAWKLPYVVSPSLPPPPLSLPSFLGRYFTFLFFAVPLLYFTFGILADGTVCVCVCAAKRKTRRTTIPFR